MSWNPFSRLSHGSSRKSAISRTEEREFERDYKKLEQLDEVSKKLYKDMKKCCETQTAQSKGELRITQDLLGSSLCQGDEQLKPNVESWNHAVTRLDLYVQEQNATSQKTVIEPLKKFQNIFPSVQTAVKKREQSLLEYNKWLAKKEKYQERERTGHTVVKLDMIYKMAQSRKALNIAKEDFESQNGALREDMPKLYEGRIDYIEPSFEALIKSQVRFYTEAHKIYGELSKRLHVDGDDLSDEDYNQKISQKLSDIRALSITVDD